MVLIHILDEGNELMKHKKGIVIYSDSLKTVEHFGKDRKTNDLLTNLEEIEKIIVWIPGYKNILGNEVAD